MALKINQAKLGKFGSLTSTAQARADKSIFGKNCFIFHKEKVKRSQLRTKNHNIIDFIF